MACRISVPQPGVNPGPWQWKLRVLTTGSLGHLQDSPFWRLRYLQIDRWVQQSFVISLDSGGEQKTLKVWSWLLFCPHYPFFFFFPWANHQSAFYYPHFTEEETGSEILDHFQGTHSWYLAELEFEFQSGPLNHSSSSLFKTIRNKPVAWPIRFCKAITFRFFVSFNFPSPFLYFQYSDSQISTVRSTDVSQWVQTF